MSPEDVDVLCNGGREAVLKAVRNPPVPDEGDVQAELVALDSSREVIEDPEVSPSTVVLHIYDLHKGLQRANEVLAFSSESMAVGGAFHTGVEVFGSEWSYGCCGVCSTLPRSTTQHRYHCSILLGETELDRFDLEAVISEMCQEWQGADYQIIGRNCCLFAADLCDRLGVGPMPPWVNRFARLLQVGHEAGLGAIEAGWETSEVVCREVTAASEATLAASRAASEIAIEASKVIGREAVTHSQEASRFLQRQVRRFARQTQPQLQAIANSALEASAVTAERAKAALNEFLDQAMSIGGQELETSTEKAVAAVSGFLHQVVGDVHKKVGVGGSLFGDTAAAPKADHDGLSRGRKPPRFFPAERHYKWMWHSRRDGSMQRVARNVEAPQMHWQQAPSPHAPSAQACQHLSRAGSFNSTAGPHPQSRLLVHPAMASSVPAMPPCQPGLSPCQSFAALSPCQSFAAPPHMQGPRPGIGQLLRRSTPTPLRRASLAF